MIDIRAKKGIIIFLLLIGTMMLYIAIMLTINVSIVLGGLFLIFSFGCYWVTYYRIYDISIDNRSISVKRSLTGSLLIERESIDNVIIDTFWSKENTNFYIADFNENEFSRFYFKIKNINVELNKSTHTNYDLFISFIQPLIKDKVFTYLDTKKVKDRKRLIIGIVVLILFLALFVGLLRLEMNYKK
jgi:hypothetical protein